MKRILSTCAAGALVVGGSILAAPQAHAAEPPSYSVMLLDLSGTDQRLSSEALGVNNNSDVVGRTFGEGLYEGPSIWPSRSGSGGKGPFYNGWTANDIAADGRILGSSPDGSILVRSYDPWGTEQEVLAPNGLETIPEHISENGVAVIRSAGISDNPRVFTATSASDYTELLPPAETSNPGATGISDDGRRVAGLANHRNTSVPVVWTDGVGKRLSTPSGHTWSRLEAVNNSGQAVGCSLVAGAERPYRYDAAGNPTALPLPTGFTSACANAINNAGMIAGTATKGGTKTAVVWLDGRVHVLDNLVHRRSGYTLSTVTDINANGQVVGRATLSNGKGRGYIATASTAETIYTTPGLHSFNGREWQTTCERYSVTSRCRTEIVATHVVWDNGTYKRVTGWTFNNLTYTPSPRAPWATNPLAETGSWTATDGRKWRTECDTPATGRNGCRSYAFVRVAEATPRSGGGYSISVTEKWVFNNIVKFS